MKTFQLKFKPLLVLLLMGTFLFSSMPSFAQSLEGKWIPPGDNNVSVMQFTKDSLVMYNLDKPIHTMAYHVKDNDINIGTDRVTVVRFVNPNRLRAKTDPSNGSKDVVRLKLTKTKLTSAEIRKTGFDLFLFLL